MQLFKKSSSPGSKNGIDMLSGPLYKKLLLFSLPLVASGMLQQSFNAIDIAVVGHYAGSQALAAVGGNAMVINIMVNLFVGISVGANVVAANYIGRGNNDGVRRVVSTVAIVSVVSGFLLMAMGLLFSRPILEAMSTPADVIELASLYLRIFFLGMPFMMIFNFGSALLRSIGDTTRPFYMLVAGGIVNTILNLVLVIEFGMSVAGVAIATVAAQGVSAALMVRVLRREKSALRLDMSALRIDRDDLKRILKIGVPAGLQGMIFSFANIFVQTGVNSFGSLCVAGSAAAVNFESYSYFIIYGFVQAAVAFVSQNYGAGNYERCRDVFRKAMLLAVVSSGFVDIVVFLMRSRAIALFSSDTAIYEYAFMRMMFVLLPQFIACSYEIAGGALRGLGRSLTPTLITVFGTCVLRLFWIFVIFPHFATFRSLMVIYPLSWCVTGIAMLYAWSRISTRAFQPLACKAA